MNFKHKYYLNSIIPSFSSEALAVLSRMPFLIKEAKQPIANFVDGMEADGNYTLIDEIYALNLGKESSIIGFKVTSGINNNEVTFDPEGGFFDGVDQFIETGWRSSVNGVKFTQNDASMGAAINILNKVLVMALGGETTTPRDQIYFNSLTSFSHQVNGSAAQTVAHLLTAPFLTSVGRVNTDVTVYGDGVAAQAPVTDVSKPVNSTSNMRIGTRTAGGLYFDGVIGLAYFGAEVGFDHLKFKNRLDTFNSEIIAAWSTFNHNIFKDELLVTPTDPNYTITNFSYASQALSASGTFAFGAAFIKNQINSYLDDQATKYTIIANDNTSKIAFGKVDAQKGSLAMLDMNLKELYLTRHDTGIEPNWAVLTPVTFAWNITNGDILELEVRRETDKIIATVKNVTTNNIVRFVGDRLGLCRESPILYFYNGDISVKKITYSSNIREDVKCAIYGDSITEGDQLYTYGSDFFDRYASLIKNDLKNDCLISGLSGQNSTNLPTQMTADLDNHTPEYVIVLIGANDNNFTTWQNNILNNIIPKIVAVGAIPILCTITPRASVQAFINSANSWILGQGTYKYIDMAFAVTTSGDRINWIAGYDLDGVHPSATGHAAMFARTQTDLPELFI